MREYKFSDNDSHAAAKFLPDKRVITLAQAKLSSRRRRRGDRRARSANSDPSSSPPTATPP